MVALGCVLTDRDLYLLLHLGSSDLAGLKWYIALASSYLHGQSYLLACTYGVLAGA